MKTFSLKSMLLVTIILGSFLAGTQFDLNRFLVKPVPSMLSSELEAAVNNKRRTYSSPESKLLELDYLRHLKNSSDIELQKRFVLMQLHEKALLEMSVIESFHNTPLRLQPIATTPYIEPPKPRIPLTLPREKVLNQLWQNARETIKQIVEIDPASPTIERFERFRLREDFLSRKFELENEGATEK